MVATKTLYMKWRGNDLYWGRRKLSAIAPDAKYPGMWRVIEADGSLSDMVNLTRARDAARSRASKILEEATR